MLTKTPKAAFQQGGVDVSFLLTFDDHEEKIHTEDAKHHGLSASEGRDPMECGILIPQEHGWALLYFYKSLIVLAKRAF